MVDAPSGLYVDNTTTGFQMFTWNWETKIKLFLLSLSFLFLFLSQTSTSSHAWRIPKQMLYIEFLLKLKN